MSPEETSYGLQELFTQTKSWTIITGVYCMFCNTLIHSIVAQKQITHAYKLMTFGQIQI